MIKLIETEIKDCYILEPKRFGDNRGYFSSITKEDLKELGFSENQQASISYNVEKGVLRGLHAQKEPFCQAKVVTCRQGGSVDIAVDMRKDSPTYGKYIDVELTPENGRMLYIPRGCYHGYLTTLPNTLFEYYVDNKYMPRYEDGILWNDPNIQIDWKSICSKYDINLNELILSEKDKNRDSLKDKNLSFTRRKKRFLITGYNGQLGFDIARELEQRGEFDYLAIDKDELDITDRDAVIEAVRLYKPDVIFHCAAWTAVDKAENLKELVHQVNVEGTKNLTDASIEVGAKMIYLSTDYVFDGTKEGLYNETDKVNPQSIYGLTKFLGEEEVKRNPNHYIARISWVFGINGNNFIKTMINLSNNYEKLNVVNDQIGSPTYTRDIARLLVEMAHTDKYGLYHVTNENYCSWADFAKEIMKKAGKSTIINPVTTEEYYQGKDMSQIAYRPKNSKLDKTKLENNFALLPTWENALERYIEELEQDKFELKAKIKKLQRK